ncbi:hypothetical protein BKA93DRAFT_822982 [Sparassis latifolia]
MERIEPCLDQKVPKTVGGSLYENYQGSCTFQVAATRLLVFGPSRAKDEPKLVTELVRREMEMGSSSEKRACVGWLDRGRTRAGGSQQQLELISSRARPAPRGSSCHIGGRSPGCRTLNVSVVSSGFVGPVGVVPADVVQTCSDASCTTQDVSVRPALNGGLLERGLGAGSGGGGKKENTRVTPYRDAV